jgi:uncharacterized protein YndB with AHSA1/START domain
VVVTVEGEIVIDRPPDEVFDFVADQRNEPRYNPRMRHVEQLSEGPIGLGTRFRARTTSRGRAVDTIIEITAYDPPRRLGDSTHMAFMDLPGGLSFDPVPGGTRMRWLWQLGPPRMPSAMGPLVPLVGHRQERQIWTGLKRRLEGP